MTTTALRVCQNMRKTVAPQERKACCNHYCRITSIARPIGAFHTSIARPIGTILISFSRSIRATYASITRPIRAIQPTPGRTSRWHFHVVAHCLSVAVPQFQTPAMQTDPVIDSFAVPARHRPILFTLRVLLSPIQIALQACSCLGNDQKASKAVT